MKPFVCAVLCIGITLSASTSRAQETKPADAEKIAPVLQPQTAPHAAAPLAAPPYESDPRFKDAMKEARLLDRQQRFNFSVDAYKKANKIAGGACFDCLNGLYNAHLSLADYKAAIADSVSLEAIATSPMMKARAQTLRAQVLLAQSGEKAKPDQLQAADAQLKLAIATDPKFAPALYLDGIVLARLGRMEDARAEFKQCLTCAAPNDPSRLRAEHFVANPALATQKMAPAFTVTALDGSKFTLDAMGGRVVLIDFWATWCGPCNEELPHMKKIAKEFAGQPLVIISVSWDRDETKWKEFIAKNEMTWVQYRDPDNKLGEAFGVHAIPHYFTIDADGVLTAEMLGEGSNVEGKLKKLVAKARESIQSTQEKTVASTAAAPTNKPGN